MLYECHTSNTITIQIMRFFTFLSWNDIAQATIYPFIFLNDTEAILSSPYPSRCHAHFWLDFRGSPIPSYITQAILPSLIPPILKNGGTSPCYVSDAQAMKVPHRLSPSISIITLQTPNTLLYIHISRFLLSRSYIYTINVMFHTLFFRFSSIL